TFLLIVLLNVQNPDTVKNARQFILPLERFRDCGSFTQIIEGSLMIAHHPVYSANVSKRIRNISSVLRKNTTERSQRLKRLLVVGQGLIVMSFSFCDVAEIPP